MAELDARRIEVLGMSAITIQRKTRTYFTRKKFIMLQISTIQIQSICRGNSWNETFIYFHKLTDILYSF